MTAYPSKLSGGEPMRIGEDVRDAISQIRNDLSALCFRLGHAPTESEPSPIVEDDDIVQFAESLYKMRRQREGYFPQQLFGEPAWDLFLELFVAARRGQRVSVSSACIAAAVPPTTGLRWLKAFEQDGYVIRTRDVFDQRRWWVRLTDQATEQVQACLEKLHKQKVGDPLRRRSETIPS